jgi:hypothetical protein
MADVNIKGLIEQAIKLADVASAFIPGAGLAAGGARLAGKIVDVIDTLTAKAPDQKTTEQLLAARDKLRASVSAKAGRTSARLRG